MLNNGERKHEEMASRGMGLPAHAPKTWVGVFIVIKVFTSLSNPSEIGLLSLF